MLSVLIASVKVHLRYLSQAAVGLLLLTAFSLKAYEYTITLEDGWLAASRWTVIALQWEILLGVWLLTGVNARLTWLLAVGTFLLYAGVNLFKGVTGEASCGCLGRVETSPWSVFSLDLFVLLVLFLACPSMGDLLPSPRFASMPQTKWGVVPALGVAVLGVVGVMWLPWLGVWGEVALAKLRGDSIVVVVPEVNLGSVQAGEDVEGRVAVMNVSDQVWTLIGGISNGSISVTEDLPVALHPHNAETVRVKLRVPKNAPRQKRYSQKVYFWSDCPSQERTWFVVEWEVE